MHIQSNRDHTFCSSIIAAKLELPEPTRQDIEVLLRISARQGKKGPIIIRFTDRSLRAR